MHFFFLRGENVWKVQEKKDLFCPNFWLRLSSCSSIEPLLWVLIRSQHLAPDSKLDSRVLGWHRGSNTVSQPSFICSFYPHSSPSATSVHPSTLIPVRLHAIPLPALRQWKRWSLSDEGFLLKKKLSVSPRVYLFDNSHWFHKLRGKSKKEGI